MRKIVLALLFSAAVFADDFVVGTSSGYAPFVSLDSQGNYEGFDIDVARLVAERLGKTLVIKDFGSMPSQMLALKQNRIDALIWAISITEERKKNLNMIHYQGDPVTTLPFLFWNKVPKGISTIADLQEVCVEAGSFQEAVVASFPQARRKNVEKIMDVLLSLKTNKVMAAAVDPALLPRIQKQYPQMKLINLPIPEAQQALGNGICINKQNTALAQKVQEVVDSLKSEGKIRELEEKWGLTP